MSAALSKKNVVATATTADDSSADNAQKKAAERAEKAALAEITRGFYPATRFTSWGEFFGLGASSAEVYKDAHAKKGPNGKTLAGVKWYHRVEMLIMIASSVATILFWGRRLYYISRDLKSFVPAGTEVKPMTLDPPRFLPDLLGPGIDVADYQLSQLEKNSKLLGAGLLVYVLISQLTRRLLGPTAHFIVYTIMGLLFAVGVHGWGSIVLAGIVFAHYIFTVLGARFLPRWLFRVVMWSSLIALLVGAEWKKGFADFFIGTDGAGGLFPTELLYKYLPLKDAVLMGWNNTFNMVFLRLVAFSEDFLEATSEQADLLRKETPVKHETTCITCSRIAQKLNSENKLVASEIKPLCYKARTETPRPVAQYNLFTFFAFVFYVPLYIAGPVTCFNAFVSHAYTPQRSFPRWSDIIRYSLRVVGVYFCLVVFNHLLYLQSITKQPAAMMALPLIDQSGAMFLMLTFLWLKFSVIWKGFRAVALLDGVEAPEDINRCFANAVKMSEFWRDWHASFNSWTVRCMYIPMGGQKYKALVIFPIFLFMAIWHDTELHLLLWAMIICVTTVLELAATALLSKIVPPSIPFYRYLVTIGGMMTVFGLILSNAVGLGSGMASLSVVKDTVASGATDAIIAWICLVFPTTSVALIDREIEKNQNVKAKKELEEAKQIATVKKLK